MSDIMTWMGREPKYWIELQARLEKMENGPRMSDLISEIADLRGKLDFMRSRIREVKDI